MESAKAFILKVYKHGESDLIVHALTSTGDKRKFFARAALKSRKRFGGGVLEPTHYVSLNYRASTREEGLDHLLEAQIIDSFDSLRTDYDRLSAALYFVSVVDRLSFQGLVDAKSLFDLLGNGLLALQVTPAIEALKTQFQLKILHSQGVLPHIEGADAFLERTLREGVSGLEPEVAHRVGRLSGDLLSQYLD